MPKHSRSPLIAVASLGLVGAGLVFGATGANAGDIANDCATQADTIEFATSGAFWTGVCAQDGSVDEGGTPHKNDPFDGFGYIQLDNGTSLPINVPAADAVVESTGSTTTITYTDVAVDAGGGDLVDIRVARTFAGSFVSWQVSVFDADDDSPRADVPLELSGNLGSDSATVVNGAGQWMVSSGDPADPVLAWQAVGANAAFSSGGVDTVLLEFENAVTTLYIGMVDYGCTADAMDDAVTYATSLAPTLSDSFGLALVAPGSTFCSTAPTELYLVPGQPFSVTIPVTYTDAFDFGPLGGEIYDWNAPAWVTEVIENDLDTPGVIPTLTIVGVAPASGSGLFSFDTAVYNGQGEYLAVAGNWITLIAAQPAPAPVLAATGVASSPVLWAAAGGLLLLGAGAVVAVRVLRRQG